VNENCLKDKSVIRVGSYRGHGIISNYLAESALEFMDIGFAFPGRYTGLTLVHFDEYRYGRLVSSRRFGIRLRSISLAIQRIQPYLLNFVIAFVVLVFVTRNQKKYDIFLMTSMSPASLLVKMLGVAKRSVLLSDDTYCLEGHLLNRAIQSFLLIVAKNLQNSLKEIWYVSPRLIKFKQQQKIIENPNVRRKIVPHGVDLRWLKWRASQKIEETTIAYFGAVVPGRGLELLLDSLNKVIEFVPNAKLKIVGEEIESYGKVLRGSVLSLNLQDHVQFIGHGKNEEDDLKKIATCAIGVAIYDGTQISILYTDSSKIKKYLSCGMPVMVSSRLPYSIDIEKARAGIAVSNDRDSIASALIRFLTDSSLRKELSVNATKYGTEFEYHHIYGEAFRSF